MFGNLSKPVVNCIALLALMALLAACSAGSGKGPAQPAGTGLDVLQPQALPLTAAQMPLPPAALPAPSALLAMRQASSADAPLCCEADDFSSLIPARRVKRLGPRLEMYPVNFSGPDEALGAMASALYELGLDNYFGEPRLELNWLKAPTVPGRVYISLANFETDRWDIYLLEPGAALELNSLEAYTSQPEKIMLALVLAGGSEDLVLQHIRLGGSYDEVEDNDDYNLSPLPDADFSAYSGSIGSGPGYAGNDGDNADNYRLFARPGDRLELDIAYDDSQCMLQAELSDMNGIVLSTVSGASPLQIVRTLSGPECGPLLLALSTANGFSDYEIGCDFSRAPVARLSADKWQGPAPLTVNFNAAFSFDPDNAISKYEWDFDGDGSYDLDSGLATGAQFEYMFEGTYRATLRVTDGSGRQGLARATVTVGEFPYHEVEPNDLLSELCRLPILPFTDYRGNVGTSIDKPGYDGDDADGYVLFLEPGKKASFCVDFDPVAAPDLKFYLADAYVGNIVEATPVAPGRLALGLTAASLEHQPYYLIVGVLDGSQSDYSISGSAAQPPAAALSASASAGLAPLDLSFSAQASVADGQIVKYEWDWNGDLVFDQSTGAQAFAVHNFAQVGHYKVTLRVTDEKGGQSTASQLVYAWPTEYDELEPNNYFNGEVLHAPALPFSGFRGSIGSGPGYPGYSGDENDYYVLDGLSAGQTLKVDVAFDQSSAELIVLIIDSDNNWYWQENSVDGLASLQRTLDGSEAFPMLLWVGVASGGYTDYELSASVL